MEAIVYFNGSSCVLSVPNSNKEEAEKAAQEINDLI